MIQTFIQTVRLRYTQSQSMLLAMLRLQVIGARIRVNLSLAFREVTAATSTAVQSARAVSRTVSDVRVICLLHQP